MKKLLTLILALGLLLSVASFAAAEEKVTLNLTYAGSVDEFTPIQNAIDTHAGDLEGIEINVIHIPAGEYWNKVTTMFAGNAAPDVLFMSEPFPQYASKGLLLRIDDKMTELGLLDLDEWYQVGLDYFTWDGGVYGLPKDVNVYCTYFNKALFEEAGLETPDVLAERGEWTREAFREAAIALTRRDGDSVTQYGCAFADLDGWYSAPWIFSAGAQFLNEDRTECLLNSQAAVDTYQFWHDLAYVDRVTPTPGTPSDALTGMSFQTGKIAMSIGGDWEIASDRSCDFEWGVAPMPVAEGMDQYSGYVHIGGWAIASATEHPEEAMKVLSVLTSKEFQISMAESSVGLIPPRVKIAEEYYLTDLMPENAGVFFKMLENGTCYPFTVHDGDIDLIYAEYTDMMMEEGSDIPALADEMVEAVNEVLQG